jgi:hypothetical protein
MKFLLQGDLRDDYGCGVLALLDGRVPAQRGNEVVITRPGGQRLSLQGHVLPFPFSQYNKVISRGSFLLITIYYGPPQQSHLG